MVNCLKCGVKLTDKNWYPSQKQKNSKICKSCNLKVGNEWRRNHPQSSQQYSKQYYKTHPKYNVSWGRENRIMIRAEMISAYGGKCSRCGMDNPIVLDIGHINNDGGKERKKGLWGWRLYRLLRKNNYPTDKYQLLCRNCNWIKHMEARKK